MSHVPTYSPLPRAYFDRPTLDVARDLVGRWLVHERNGTVLAGRIVETEAYTQDDPAFHGWGLVDLQTGLVRMEGRAYDLFGVPGTAYVYLIYGAYWLLNVVTEREGVGGAVLIRALEPVRGIEGMFARRPNARSLRDLCSGPGKLTLALGVTNAQHGQDLTRPPLYFADPEPEHHPEIATSSRIGITRGTELPWRFFVPDSPFVSPGVPSDLTAARRRATKNPVGQVVRRGL
ncbi:MAG TPA: DNA-3-methyladenine glycosylase [Rhodothermales bacterium]|nr:DNA-3-methyladenine glycosylase [Rhodothermales bacterium]